jgi:hypothetical protein
VGKIDTAIEGDATVRSGKGNIREVISWFCNSHLKQAGRWLFAGRIESHGGQGNKVCALGDGKTNGSGNDDGADIGEIEMLAAFKLSKVLSRSMPCRRSESP